MSKKIHLLDSVRSFPGLTRSSQREHQVKPGELPGIIMASVFIPLTFIAGVYGMNFQFMPELFWYWSYPVIWLVFLLLTLGMLFFFWRKGWIGKT